MRLTFLKPIEEIEPFLRKNIVYANLPILEESKTENIDTKKILRKLSALEMQTKAQRNEGEDGPNSYLGLHIVDSNKIYFEDKLLPFKKNTKEIKLIKYLIRRQ